MKNKYLCVAIFIFVSLFVSCSTAPYSRRGSSVVKIAELINDKNSGYLAKISKTPFLLDGEIILLDRDIEMIWKNLSESGFAFEGDYSVDSFPVSAGDHALFASSMEVKTFFREYLPKKKKGSIAEINADNGKFYLLLGNKKKIEREDGSKVSFPEIFGFKGPVE